MGTCLLLALFACGSPSGTTDAASDPTTDTTNADDAVVSVDAARAPRVVFVVTLENKSAALIYGSADAPYLNSLLATAAYATDFQDLIPTVPSEPHYVWMEAGTNAFADHTFTDDADPSPTNSTASTEHLVNQLEAASVGWMSYQEDMAEATTGLCPVASNGLYRAKHNPFVFFQDVTGNPPSKTSARCAAHHKPYAALAGDLAAGELAGYVFITPNLCHDMHGATACPQGSTAGPNIRAGDAWLSVELPPILDYAHAHDGVVFLVWDEGSGSANILPFFALGDHVKPGATAVAYSHSSLLRSVEAILGVPTLPAVMSANDFSAMFEAGSFP